LKLWLKNWHPVFQDDRYRLRQNSLVGEPIQTFFKEEKAMLVQRVKIKVIKTTRHGIKFVKLVRDGSPVSIEKVIPGARRIKINPGGAV
jgi:hypothetical protein